MNEQYILLVMPYDAHKPCEIKGALDFISNEGILTKITSGTIIDKNLDLRFPNPGYTIFREAVSEIIENLPERPDGKKENYHFFTAEILDTETFNQNLLSIQDIYPKLVSKYIVDSPEKHNN